jgi:hypothetical protein
MWLEILLDSKSGRPDVGHGIPARFFWLRRIKLDTHGRIFCVDTLNFHMAHLEFIRVLDSFWTQISFE